MVARRPVIAFIAVLSGRLVAAFVVVLVLLAVAARLALADSVEEQSRRIGKQLQCPVCQGATVADSPSELAQQMRAVIQRKAEQGETDEQIVQYFVDRYGDSVLVSPPRRGIGLAVWLGPVFVLAVGSLALWWLVQTWLRRRPPVSTSAHPASEVQAYPALEVHSNGTAASAAGASYDDRVRAELDRFRQES